MAIVNKTDNGKCGKDVKKCEPLYTVGLNVKWCSHFSKFGNVSEFKAKTTIYDTASPFLGIYLREMKTCLHKSLCVKVQEALSRTVKNWEQPKTFTKHEWKDKTESIHMVEFYLAIKKKQMTDMHYIVERLWTQFAKWKKLGPRHYTLHDSIYMKCPGQENS
jgi:hypothetical protein